MNYTRTQLYSAAAIVLLGVFIYSWLQVHSLRVIDWRECTEAQGKQGSLVIICEK